MIDTSLKTSLNLSSVKVTIINNKHVLEVEGEIPVGKNLKPATFESVLRVDQDLHLHTQMFLQAVVNHLHKLNREHDG